MILIGAGTGLSVQKGSKMTKYYKAVIIYYTEQLEKNSDGEYEGCNPDTFQDHGVTHTFTGTLEYVETQVHHQLSKLKSWEYDEVNNSLTWSCEGEHDYRTPLSERIPFIDTYTLYLTEVVETEQDPRQLQKVGGK